VFKYNTGKHFYELNSAYTLMRSDAVLGW